MRLTAGAGPAGRRLTLTREPLGALAPGGFQAAAISLPHLTCLYTSAQYTECASCGVACSFECPTYYCR